MDGKIYYITKEKLHELKKEYEELLEIERKKSLGETAPKIFESEDLNPEFVSFQEDIGFLRSRIDELKGIVEHHELIKSPTKDKQGIVSLGAKVKIIKHADKGSIKIDFFSHEELRNILEKLS